MKQKIYNVLLFLCAAVIGYGSYQIFITKQEYKQAQKTYKNIQRAAKTKHKVKFDALKKTNPDVVAWIEIPGTQISYPVVKGKDNNEYLHKTFSGEKNRSGCIFLDVKCNSDFSSDHNIIYGHHMRDGSMFAELVKFRKTSFVKKHHTIILYLPEKTKKLQVVSAYAMQPEKIPITFADEKEKNDYIQKIKKRSDIKSGNIKGNIYTFVTCSYETENNRTYVHAIEEEPWKETIK